ncbi:alkaline phosphatase isoform X2 [Procambarus clarkii]|nr:alkaline phosphatase-like [Procambarus clarkii]
MCGSGWRGLLLLVTVSAAFTSSEFVYPSPHPRETESSYWNDLARKELEEAIHKPKLTNVAKNVILFLGDGMGITVNTAGRILKGQKKGVSGEEGFLVWDRFPNVGLLKTYNVDKQVPDSAATATAFLAGVKANYYTLGVNGKVKRGNCEASLKAENRVDSILKWAQDADKSTGVVTTAQVTHATPAALYAKSADRRWQCETKIFTAGEESHKCKDIALQLVEDEPATKMKVIIGGGRQELGAPLEDNAEKKCVRTDGRNLVDEWKKVKTSQGETNAYVTTTRELQSLDTENTEYIMGLFGDLHVPYEVDRNTSLDGTPSLKEMVQVALRRLLRDDDGFFLLVEGGRIDHGLHYGQPLRALEELLAMEEALNAAMEMVNLEETLIVVTADHSHVMTINGYPERGNNILGVVMNEDDVSDHMPYTTLMFTNGHGFNYTWTGEEVMRRNLTGVDTNDKDFEPLAAVPTYAGSETHGGEDVGVYAIGPMAHLFHRVHEQNYVAHVMAYASCIGPYADDCKRPVQIHENVYNHVKNLKKCKANTGTSTNLSFVTLVSITIVHVIRQFGC